MGSLYRIVGMGENGAEVSRCNTSKDVGMGGSTLDPPLPEPCMPRGEEGKGTFRNLQSDPREARRPTSAVSAPLASR